AATTCTGWTPPPSTPSSGATGCSTSRRSRCPTKTELERRAPPGRRLDAAQLAAVGPRDAPRDREPEPGAAVLAAGLVQPHEPVEDPLAVGGWDARPLVGDEHGGRVARRHGDGHGARPGVAPRVVEEVSQHLGEPGGVAGDGDR